MEQRLMTKREIQEIGNCTKATPVDGSHPISVDGDGTSEGATPTESGGTEDDYFLARSSGRNLAGGAPSASSVAAAVAMAPEGIKRPNSRSTAEPKGLEVLQLMAKGQALSSAVVVVEGVLHKMEEQASGNTVVHYALFFSGAVKRV